MKAFLRGLHRWCGLAIALFVAITALTGSLIAFEHELDAWLNPALFKTGDTRPALPFDTLLARIESQDGRIRVTQLPLDTPPGQASEAQVEARPGAAVDFDRLFVDPASGRILGTRKWGAWNWDRAHLMPWLNRFHRNLALPGPWGGRLLGWVSVAWLLISLAGVYLTLPTRGGRPWRAAWRMSPGARGLKLVNDLHRTIGLWTLAVALPIAFTGIYLGLGNEVFKPIASLFGPVSPHPVATRAPVSAPSPAPPISPLQSVVLARALLPEGTRDYEPWYFGHLASRGMYRVAFKEKDLRESALRVRYEQVFIDDRTGELAGRFGYASGTPVDRFLVWQYPVHSGKVLGPLGRALVALGGALIALLCVVGVMRYGMRTAAPRMSSNTASAGRGR